MTSREEIVLAAACEIERHLAAHPDAADSAEGIRHWWLPPLLRSMSLDLVIAALQTLQIRGVVEKKKLEGVGDIYSKGASLGKVVH